MRFALLALLGLVVAGCSAGGDNDNPASRVYTDETFGYSIRYPGDWHLDTSKDQFLVAMWETTIANFDAGSDPSRRVRVEGRRGESIHLERNDRLGTFPPQGVALRIFHFEGGPGYDYLTPEARFPLSLDEFKRSSAPYAGLGIAIQPRPTLRRVPRPVEYFFAANGWTFYARAWIGSAASQVDRSRLREVVLSLRFPQLRTGGAAANERFDVLGYADQYRAPSAQRVGRKGFEFFLVHAPGGFYGLQVDCGVDRRKLQFACPNGWRWDRIGAPLGETPEPLAVLPAKVAQDGHVLVAREVRTGPSSRMRREFWRR